MVTYRRNYRALTWIWALATAALLLVPGDSLPASGLSEALETVVELGVHLFLFLALAYLAGCGYGGSVTSIGSTGSTGWRHPAGRRSRVLAAVLAFCVLLEILQIAIPGRGFEFVDIAVGCLGALLGFRRRR